MQRWDDLTPEEQARYEDRELLLAQLAAATQRAEAAEAQIANDYYKRRTEELATELNQLRTELACVLETAIMRGESLGYTTADDDYRERLQELDPNAEILQDIEQPRE